MSDKKLTEKKLEISKIILTYLDDIEDDNSILKGNLLKPEEKEFILNDLNAFIIGLISDQSVKAETAWSLPYKLYLRLNTFDFEKILNQYSEKDLENIIREKPALHRYPTKMASYIYSAINDIVTKYGSNAENIWKDKRADEIVALLEQFKGISHKKASLGTLILVRDLSVEILDKENIDIAYDIHIRRLFLRLGLVDKDEQGLILKEARFLYPEFPGRLTTAFWTLGRNICRPTDPACLICPLYEYCNRDIEKTKDIK